jgi:DNA processing protein
LSQGAAPTVRPWIALSLTPGLGQESLRRLLTEFGLPERVFEATYASLCKLVAPEVARSIADNSQPQGVDQALAWLERPGNHLITLADSEYPAPLLELADPPAILYVKGRVDLLSASASLAIVGSRNATPQGLLDAHAFAAALSDQGVTIVSGLALGIDAAAHRGALSGPGSTIAVVGTGLDSVYPARNRALAHELAERGALLSEFPLGTPAAAGNFPRRNRLISGLAQGCLVIEAALSSGSLITARLAAEQGREVFALPGSIHSPLAKGPHRLIKQGAKLVEAAQDIMEEFKWAAPVERAPSADRPSQAAGPLLSHMGPEPTGIDTLIQRSGLSAQEVVALLLQLELDGRVASVPGGRYQKIFDRADDVAH